MLKTNMVLSVLPSPTLRFTKALPKSEEPFSVSFQSATNEN
jgi:hypothetical protein